MNAFLNSMCVAGLCWMALYGAASGTAWGGEHQFVRPPQAEAINKAIQEAYKKKDWAHMEKKSLEWIKLYPSDDAGYYNVACAQVLLGKKEDAFGNLTKSAELGNSDLKHLEGDKDMVSLHADKRWAEVIAKVKKNVEKHRINEKLSARRMEIMKMYYGAQFQQVSALCDAFLKENPDAPDILLYRAGCQAMLGKKNEAFQDLEKYIAAEKHSVTDLQAEKQLESLKRDSRFKALLAKANEKNEQLKAAKQDVKK